MRNIALDTVDATPRPVLAIGTDYPHGQRLPPHTHRRAQFLYGMTGLMEVETADGAWVVPPHAGVWIPAGARHAVRMVGVATRSLYIEPAAAPRPATGCEVLTVGALLHQLLLAAADLPALYDQDGRDGALIGLILHELAAAPVLPVFAPLPPDPRLGTLCREFMQAPDIRIRPEDWACRLAMSPRSFTRFFRSQTGLSFGVWRRQACLMTALSRLAAGQPVTGVALDLGYESPPAFSTMVRRMLGRPPSALGPDAPGQPGPGC
ncbi:helix-turn-helix transcriptional regulator [Tistrella mobilis]|uniref:AraC family transcriptional regulator n=1 Tax=Tistrella mobilis TaxID=171437 RepID=UPI003556CDD2